MISQMFLNFVTPGITCTIGWSDFSFLWNFEKKQVGVVTFGKKTCFHKKFFLINSKTETRRPHRVPIKKIPKIPL